MKIKISKSKRGTFTAAAKKRGMGVQEFASKVLANPDNYSESMRKKAQFAHNSKSWRHAFGGNLFPWGGSFIDDPKLLENKDLAEFYFNAGATEKGLYDIDNNPGLDAETEAYLDALGDVQAQQAYNDAKATSDRNWGITAMRAAPVAGSAMQALSDALGWTNKPNYAIARTIGDSARRIRTVASRPIGNYMTYNPMDVDYLLNRLQNQNLGLQRGALDMASGNAGAARNAMLYSNRVASEQEGDAYRRALEYNDARRNAVQQFNASIDQFNAQQGLQADVYNQRRDEAVTEAMINQARLMDAVESAASQARSANITGFYNNVGQFGNDRLYADMVRQYPELMGLYNDRVRASLPTYTRACGGKLKRVREFKR